MRGRTALWFGVFGGLAAWIAHLALSYAAVPLVCGTPWERALHLLTLVAMSVAGAAAGTAWRARRRLTNAGAEAELDRFLAAGGVLLSGFFLFLVLIEGLPALLQDEPCRFVPVGEQPIVLLAGVPGALVPGAGWASWTWDLRVLGILYLATGVYLVGLARLWRRAGRGRGIGRWRAAAYLAGVAALVVALLSPVHALGEVFFAAHMVQHLLLVVVAAPLLVLGRPWIAGVWALPPRGRRALSRGWRRARRIRRLGRAATHPLSILVLHVTVLWVWHAPELYRAALEVRILHDLEHITFFVSAVLFWWVLAQFGRRGGAAGYGAAILYVFAAALQGGALGALILFAPRPLYPWHEAGATARGMDPLVDQQIAGVLMWVPAGLVYTAAGVALFVAWLRAAEARTRWSGMTRHVAVLAAALLLAGCDMGRPEAEPRQVAGGDPEAGREAIVRHGCGACHTIPGIDAATGRVAPPLTAFADRGFVAGVLPNNAEELVRWIRDPPEVNPATAMPDLGVSEADARHMAAYLYTLR